ncbi:hypothetical protein [Lysobacter gummosus]|uniref:hypothetical protein n=1 Tax=Lysobacter gummosus TaxID=262324 RepID=UPI0036440494
MAIYSPGRASCRCSSALTESSAITAPTPICRCSSITNHSICITDSTCRNC